MSDTDKDEAETKSYDDLPERDLNYQGEPREAKEEFVYATHLDPARQATPGGIYLDDVQRREAEIERARVEEREPDLDNPPPIAGTPLVPVHVAKERYPYGSVEDAEKVVLPVVEGTNDENLLGNADAIAERERAEQEKDEEPATPSTPATPTGSASSVSSTSQIPTPPSN